MIMTINEELLEICKLLEGSKMYPMLADTEVPYFDAGVHAGNPTDLGESTNGEFIRLPRSLVGLNPVIVVPVIGDSMKDAGILEGDRLQVQIGAPIHDGDIVVVSIDNECTVKAYCEDEMGDKWLVPRNDAYNSIRLTEEMNVYFIGKVVGQMKDAPRTSYNELMKSIKRTRGKVGSTEKKLTPERLQVIILEMGDVVKHGRQWYAVYRSMVDKGVLAEGEYSSFTDKVASLLPEHGHLPVASELKRMSVQSFRKPAALWERGNAPVSGQRFDDYLRIANLTTEKLRR